MSVTLHTPPNPYNQFIPAITHEIALLARPPTLLFVVTMVGGYEDECMITKGIFSTFEKASQYLIEQCSEDCCMNFQYNTDIRTWNISSTDKVHPCSPPCACDSKTEINIELVDTDLGGLTMSRCLFTWTLYGGRFYNGFRHGTTVMMKRKSYGCTLCFVHYLNDEQEVEAVRPYIRIDNKMKTWREFREHPPTICKVDTENKLSENEKFILNEVVRQVETVNEGEMMTAFRSDVHKFLIHELESSNELSSDSEEEDEESDHDSDYRNESESSDEDEQSDHDSDSQSSYCTHCGSRDC
jgi:hypothetical protein